MDPLHKNAVRLLGEKDAEIARLRATLQGIAEFCSGDATRLGAIARLTHIRNTAQQAITYLP
jgi:hypothetical protein